MTSEISRHNNYQPNSSLEHRVNKLECKLKKDNIILKYTPIVVSVLSLILTIIVNWNTIEENIFVYPKESHIEKFIDGYSEAYSKVVNNYLSNREDWSPLDKYIANTELGRKFKKEIIEKIKNKEENGEYKKGVTYTHKFNYATYIPIKETKTSEVIVVSGVTTYTDEKGSKPITDSESRIYQIIVDKLHKDIKIESRNHTTFNEDSIK